SLVVQNGDVFGTARHAVLRVRGVPVFYAPYIRFPVTDERQSGWLFPNLSYRERDGFDISLPYYFNLAPNYDATLSPRQVGDRGAGVEGSFRYLSRWQQSSFRGALLYQDDLYDGELSRGDFEQLRNLGQVTGEFEPANRWLYGMRHAGRLGGFSTLIDYTAVSDRDYFRDLGNQFGAASEIALERRGEIRYAAPGLAVRLWAQRFQRLDEGRIDPYQRLPQLDASYQTNLLGPLQWSLAGAFANFDRDNAGLTGVNAIVGQRLHLEPRVRLPLSAQWGFFTATGGYRYTRYDLSDQPVDLAARPDRGIGFGILHGGLFFERGVRVFGANLMQTLEPQLYYLYQEFEPQAGLPRFDATRLTFGYNQLFRDNRFSGLDRIGDANQLSVGVTSRFVDAGSGREYLRGSLGQIVYFRDRLVTVAGAPRDDDTQSTSALAGELAGRLAGDWQLSSTIIWNPHDNEVDEGAAALQYRRDNRHIVNVGYRWRLQDDIEQSDMSLYWPVSKHYSVVGRWNYDFGSGRTVEAFGGIEYNDCCWQIRVMARRFLDSPTGRDLDTVEADDGVFLQIVFKGLAGFGTKVESVLERGIRGYRTETFDGF
ncbi:MAG: LPS-assembly protein LptD, partial [Pseudomonadales bacterium]